MKSLLTNCLNCGTVLESNFCKNCGQKASTHRFSIKELVSKDFLSGFFDLERGFLFTLKSLFTRPGYFVKEYIEGKRKSYFHFLTFLLIVIGISVFVGEYTDIKMSDLFSEENQKKIISTVEDLGKDNPRLMILLQIPIYAFISFIWFLKSNKNYAEHIILNTYKASGELIITTIFTTITIFYKNLTVLWYLFNVVLYVGFIIYGFIMYYQFFKSFYKNKKKLFLRIVAAIISSQIIAGIIIGIIGGITIALSNR